MGKDRTKKSGDLLYFVIPLSTAFCLGLLTIITIVNDKSSLDGHKLKDIIVTCSQIFSYVFVGWGVFYTALSNKKNNEDNKVREDKFHEISNKKDIDERSFGMIVRWDSETLLKARSFSRRHKKTNPYKLAKLIRKNHELEEAVIVLLNFADNIRVGLEKDNILLNKNIIKALAPSLLDILNRFEQYYISETKNDEALNDYQETKILIRSMIVNK